MTTTATENDPLDALIEQFLAEHRRGEPVDVERVAAAHPELADRIRGLFPALLTLEALGSVVGGASGSGEAIGPGTTLGEYRLIRELGRGGMGVVYEAVQETLGRSVALKVMAVGSQGAGKFLDRFRREARTAAKLHHTNIVPVYGVGADKGVYFYAMQYIRGQSLSAVLEEVRRLRGGSTLANRNAETAGDPSSTLSRQTPRHYHREVVRLAAQAADALAYAHTHGVLHRDVKPANLLLDTDGTLWVADFGLAKADESDDLTDTGALVGTPRYMAPERFRGACDARSDVYALGATLYELLTLRPAFDAAGHPHLAAQIETGRVTPPRQHDHDIPRDLETVVLTAMAHDPADRYQTAAALADDLHNLLSDRPLTVRRPSWLAQGWRWCQRNPVVASLAATVFALVCTVAAVTLMKNRDLQQALREKGDALEAKGVALGEKEVALTGEQRAKTEAQERLRQSYLDQAALLQHSDRPGRRRQALAALRSAADIRRGDDLPARVVAALMLVDAEPATPPSDAPPVFEAGFGRLVGSLRIGQPNGFMDLVAKKGLGPVPDRGGAYDDRNPCSPDGRFVLTFKSGGRENPTRLTVWDWQAVPTPVYSYEYGPLAGPTGTRCVAWAADSGAVAFVGADQHLRVVELPSGTEISRWPAGGRPRGLAFDRANQLVAAGFDQPARVVVLDATTGRELAAWPMLGPVSDLAWSPSGGWLAAGTANGLVHLWRGVTFRGDATLAGWLALGEERVKRLRFSPHDRWLAAVLGNGLHLIDPHTGAVTVKQKPWANTDHIAFSRDGRWLRPGNAELNYRLRLEAPVEYRALVRTKAPGRIEFSPDGRFVFIDKRTTPGGKQASWVVADITTGVVWDGWRQGGDADGVLAGFGGPGNTAVVLHPATSEVALRRYAADAAGQFRLADRDEMRTCLPPVDPPYREFQSAYLRTDAGRTALAAAQRTVVTQAGADHGRFWPWNVPGGDRFTLGTWMIEAVWDPRGRFFVQFGYTNSPARVRDGTTTTDLSVPGLPVARTAAVSADGRYVALGSATHYAVWETATWTQTSNTARASGERGQGAAVAFAPTGRLLAVSDQGGIELRRPTGELLVRWDSPGEVKHLAFSPDGRYLVTAGDGVHLWDIPAIRARFREFGIDWSDESLEASP